MVKNVGNGVKPNHLYFVLCGITFRKCLRPYFLATNLDLDLGNRSLVNADHLGLPHGMKGGFFFPIQIKVFRIFIVMHQDAG